MMSCIRLLFHPFDFLPPLNGSGLLISANAESEIKSERLKKSYETRRKLAVEGKAILSATTRKAWLDYDPKTKRFIANEGAKTVKRIFQMAADGMGCFTIARQLEAEYRKTGHLVERVERRLTP